MATMKAAVAGGNGLELREVPRPAAKANEVLVRVRCAGMNRADTMRAAPKPGAVVIPGMDSAGEIAEIGAEVKGFKAGDRVMCSGPSSYAEYAVADAGRTLPIPEGMSDEQAATFPMALKTMHDAIVGNGRLRPGECVLIQGASSGVGLLGMQIAKLKGARLVIGTSTNAGRRARLGEFGADLALDTSGPGWIEQALAATGGKGIDVLIDQVSGKLVNQGLQAMAVLGRMVNVGRLGGTTGEFDFNLHALKRVHYIGVTFRTRSPEEVREITRRMREDLWDALAAGKLALPIDQVFPLEQAEAAQARMRANAHFGKIVLKVA